MGQEFGEDGRLVKYSDLFDYSSLETLQASSWLPTPKKIRVHTLSAEQFLSLNLQNKEEFKDKNRFYDTIGGDRVYYSDELVLKILNRSYNLDKHLEKISKLTPKQRAQRLRQVAETIIDMYEAMDRAGISGHVNLTYSELYDGIASLVIQDIITHERTEISANLEEAAYKNSISFNIKNIVQDLKNADLAYSPIAMRDLLSLAAESEKGALVASMSLMNPLTKYLMLVLNMVGKKVIGIAAVGEKVFFNLSYYFNEGLRSGDERWIKNLQFSRRFNRILGRYAYNKKKGDLEIITKTLLANINFSDDEIRRRFITINLVDEILRKLYGITALDIAERNEKWSEYSEELIRQTVEVEQRTGESIINFHKRLSECSPVDLLISQILSAATDNAKELILAKINCSENLAKCHLYLTMLGFDIKDTVSFMTSPCVSLINDLSEANMMDSYITSLKIDDAMEIADGIIKPSLFLFGTDYSGRDEEGFTVVRSRIDSVFAFLQNDKLRIPLVNLMKESKKEFEKFENLEQYIQTYIKARLRGIELGPLESYANIPDYETNKGFLRLSDYVEKIIYDISKAIDKYAQRYIQDNIDYAKALEMARDEFAADLAEFKKVYKLANETTTLGGVFLGMNQGLPSSKEDLQSKLRKIGEAITTREKEFGLYAGAFEFKTSEDTKDPEKALKRALKTMDRKFGALALNNKFIVEGTIRNDDGTYDRSDTELYSTMELATAFGIIGNFDIEKWLYNVSLTAKDIIADNFYGNDINILRVMQGRESIPYREVVANYYNVIKGTWNIFDMMERIPQYKAIIDLLKTEYVFDKHSSIKSYLSNIIYDKVYDKTGFIDEKQNKVILKYVDDLLTISYFRNRNFSFPIYQGKAYINPAYKTKIATSNRKIDLNNAPGRAAFKKSFEDIIAELKKTGTYEDTIIPDFENNAFLQGLSVVYDKNEVPRITMELDMMRLNSTPNSQRMFQEYLNGFNKLKTVEINGISLADWFMIYNLCVNQNQYGSDRLTTLFKNSMINKGSILEDYFKYIGNLDYNNVTQEVLRDMEFNLDDLLIRMAPTIHKSEELDYAAKRIKFIRSKNASGEYVIKRLYTVGRGKNATGLYREISTFPNDDLFAIDDSGVTEDQKSNYQMYQMMPMKNQDFSVSLREGIMSSDLETLVDTLMAYSRKGLLEIFKENC